MSTIADLLNGEVDRLNDRKVAIDEAEEERKRVIFFNVSATERQKAYNNIYLVIAVMLFVVVIIKMIYQFDLVPDTILDILTALVISAGLIYSLILYSDIMRRNNMDFSRINLETPPKKTEKQKESEINAGNLSAIQGTSADGKCIGAACCTDDQTYSEAFSICVPNTIPTGIVPTDTSEATGDYSIKYDSVDITTYSENVSGQDTLYNLTEAIVTDLTDPANYKYCRISAGNYAWLPVTLSNLQKDTGNALRIVTREDPNWVGDGRTGYNFETLSTRPTPAESFTPMESTDIKPFVTDVVYTKYV
jgi:hypothetical protein